MNYISKTYSSLIGVDSHGQVQVLILKEVIWNLPTSFKVQGPKTNTYEPLPIANTLLPWIVPHGAGVLGPTEWQF